MRVTFTARRISWEANCHSDTPQDTTVPGKRDDKIQNWFPRGTIITLTEWHSVEAYLRFCLESSFGIAGINKSRIPRSPQCNAPFLDPTAFVPAVVKRSTSRISFPVMLPRGLKLSIHPTTNPSCLSSFNPSHIHSSPLNFFYGRVVQSPDSKTVDNFFNFVLHVLQGGTLWFEGCCEKFHKTQLSWNMKVTPFTFSSDAYGLAKTVWEKRRRDEQLNAFILRTSYSRLKLCGKPRRGQGDERRKLWQCSGTNWAKRKLNPSNPKGIIHKEQGVPR